jgi:hypothetical protein
MKAFTRVRSIANALRVLAVFVFLNGLSILLPPETWIDSGLVWSGLGHMPNMVLFLYLLRGAGFVLVSFGVLIWVIASNVVRYKPVVITIIAIFLVGVPVSYLIDSIVGLPRWWCIMDSAICLLGGGIPLAFALWSSSPNTVSRPCAKTKCCSF